MIDDMALLKKAMEQMDAKDPVVAQAAKDRAASAVEDVIPERIRRNSHMAGPCIHCPDIAGRSDCLRQLLGCPGEQKVLRLMMFVALDLALLPEIFL